MADFIVVAEVPFFVRKAPTLHEAKSIAISEMGKMLNKQKLENSDIEISRIECPSCHKKMEAVIHIVTQALVGLRITIKIFNAESEEHARRICKKKLGRAIGNCPLEIIYSKKSGN